MASLAYTPTRDTFGRVWNNQGQRRSGGHRRTAGKQYLGGQAGRAWRAGPAGPADRHGRGPRSRASRAARKNSRSARRETQRFPPLPPAPAFRRGRSRLAAGRPNPGLRGTAHRRHGVEISSALAPERALSEAGLSVSPLSGMVRPRHMGPAAAQRRRAAHVLRAVMAALLSSAGRLRALRPRLPPLLPPLLRPPAAPAPPPGSAR